MSTPPNPAIDLGVGVDPLPEVTAGLQAATEVAKVVDDVVKAENTPEMIQARKNVEIQKQRDKIARDAYAALRTGDVTEVQKDLQ